MSEDKPEDTRRPRPAGRSAAAMASAPLMVAALLSQTPAHAQSHEDAPDTRGQLGDVRQTDPGEAAAADSAHAPQASGWTHGVEPGTQTVNASGGEAYKVKSGDSLFSIAKKHGTTVRKLLELNELSADAVLRPGQIVSLPRAEGAAGGGGEPAQGATHRVKPGDTLLGIALKYNTTVEALQKANAMGDSTVIRQGEILKLTGTGATSDREAASDDEDLPYIPKEFAGRTYPDEVVHAARVNKKILLSMDLPSRDEAKQLVRQTAQDMGIDPALAMAVAQQESGFNMAAVSPANAVGVMQVIPSSGRWASGLVGRQLDLLDPQDNITAGVAILRQLLSSADSEKQAIGGYYQGLASVRQNGLYSDTRRYVNNVQSLKQRFGGGS